MSEMLSEVEEILKREGLEVDQVRIVIEPGVTITRSTEGWVARDDQGRITQFEVFPHWENAKTMCWVWKNLNSSLTSPFVGLRFMGSSGSFEVRLSWIEFFKKKLKSERAMKPEDLKCFYLRSLGIESVSNPGNVKFKYEGHSHLDEIFSVTPEERALWLSAVDYDL